MKTRSCGRKHRDFLCCLYIVNLFKNYNIFFLQWHGAARLSFKIWDLSESITYATLVTSNILFSFIRSTIVLYRKFTMNEIPNSIIRYTQEIGERVLSARFWLLRILDTQTTTLEIIYITKQFRVERERDSHAQDLIFLLVKLVYETPSRCEMWICD